jgi:hypothetical protein
MQLNRGSVEVMSQLDVVVAPGAHDGVLAKSKEAWSLVLLLAVNELARVTPPLFVRGIVTVLDESQGSARVSDQVPAHGCDVGAAVLFAVNFAFSHSIAPPLFMTPNAALSGRPRCWFAVAARLDGSWPAPMHC